MAPSASPERRLHPTRTPPDHVRLLLAVALALARPRVGNGSSKTPTGGIRVFTNDPDTAVVIGYHSTSEEHRRSTAVSTGPFREPRARA